jgi:lycopene beta-cyclase
MIRGIDFYGFVKDELRKHPGVEWAFEVIRSIEDTGTGAKVSTDRGVHLADWVFDSTYAPRMNLPQYHNLLQHFKGWEIEVDTPTFNPKEATLMDFRIEQHGEARFFYVLPLDERRALVEFTVFSAGLLLPEAYETALKAYLASYLQLKNYRILHQEFGVIPMTDEALTAHPSRHVVRIGTAGGNTKPSTGYTFLRIQQHTQAIVKSIHETGKPFYAGKPFHFRFSLYDRILLNVIQEGRCETRKVFARLFKKNKASAVFRFLDETTTLPQELKIMTSVPSLPFVKAVGDVLWKKIRT